ncbi:MAG: DUF4340 domain-containing protein [Candidatus Latescibacterota bacterium]|nr:MAG: DUF4340 domain-containing protein [Candidatus Latescibacterota bacterium]
MQRVVILAVVLGVLVGIWLLQRQRQGQVVVSEPVETVSVDPARVTRLRIDKADAEAVELARVAGSWRITSPIDYRADEAVVSAVLRALEGLELEDVVSTNPDKRSTFQVDDSTGTHVEVFAGDESVVALVVGKSSPDFAHTYVRRVDADEVYRAVGVLTYNFNKRVDDWRDKTILSLDQESIAKVTLHYPKEKAQVVLAHADTLWTLQVEGGQPEVADSLSVVNLLRTASRLTTAAFVSDSDSLALDFDTPDFGVQIETDAEKHSVQFVEGEDNKYYARKEGEETIFQLYKSNLTNLMKKPEDLRPKES